MTKISHNKDKHQLGVLEHTCEPSTGEVETGGLRVQGLWWWCMSLIPQRQRQVHLHEFEASLIYKSNSKKARVVTEKDMSGGKN